MEQVCRPPNPNPTAGCPQYPGSSPYTRGTTVLDVGDSNVKVIKKIEVPSFANTPDPEPTENEMPPKNTIAVGQTAPMKNVPETSS